MGDAILVKTLHKGDGASVGLDDIVQVNYAGALFSDATVFDSSFQMVAPLSLSVSTR